MVVYAFVKKLCFIGVNVFVLVEGGGGRLLKSGRFCLQFQC